ncbi:hypothetical protein MalM25_01790 [Planctomycetes bacterium MalM25]|nr:hypothetical protein MalM25_01790 [Planctomycetes bacterium MalM25]
MLVITVAGSAAVAHAQLLPTPADTPPYEVMGEESGALVIEPAPAPATEPEVVPYEPLSPIPAGQDDALNLYGDYPAVTESSGTWMRRGLWYADLDAVIMARTWDSDGMTFIQEFDSIASQVITNVGNVQFANTVAVQSQSLGESSPGYDGAARLALGRFLFRDIKNRDHTFEMIVMGGPEWDENLAAVAQLDGTNGGLNLQVAPNQLGLHTPLDGTTPTPLDIPASFPSFDKSQAMQVEYASRFHNWEWNYNVAQRMRKDRMVLQPSGEWVRRASPSFTWDYTAGLRYFDVEERLDWFAQDIAAMDSDNGDTDGAYLIGTSNNLFGLQLGAGLTYESDRWNVTVSTKQGFAINDARATTSMTFTDPDGDTAIALNNYTTDLHENGVSYIGTGSVVARYHLRPNLSLRAGWEFMFVTGLALAPNQADFNPAIAQLHVTGDAFYHGVSFGSEYYW